MIDETSNNWTFTDDEAGMPDHGGALEPAVDDPWTSQLEPGLLMEFLSDFRSATREKAAAEKAAVGRHRGSAASRTHAAQEPEPWEIDPYQGSDAQVTPEWWFATDGRWYPPELHPDRQASVEPVSEIRETIAEVTPSIAEVTASIESVDAGRKARKSWLARNERNPGGFALEG